MNRQGMDHPHDLISAFADGEVTPAERGLVEDHLRACPECRALLEDLRRLAPALAREEPAPVPAHLAARIRWRLKGVEPAGRAARRPVWRSSRFLSAAAGLIAAAAVLWILRGEFQMDPGVQEEAPVALDGGKPETLDSPAELKQGGTGNESETEAVRIDAAADAAKPEASPKTQPEPEAAVERRALGDFEEKLESRPDRGARLPALSPGVPGADVRTESRRDEESARRASEEDLRARRLLESSAQYEKARREYLEDKGVVARQKQPAAGGLFMAESTLVSSRSRGRTLLLSAPSYSVRLTDTGQLAILAGTYACGAQAQAPPSDASRAEDTSEQAEVESIFAQASAIEPARGTSGVQPQGASAPAPAGGTHRRLVLIDAAGTAIGEADLAGPQASGEALEIEARILRLVRERMRPALEKHCGPLPELSPAIE